MLPRWLIAVLFLIGSNVFMTTAWYLHVGKKQWSLGMAILISWLIASIEYCLQVPANRLGNVRYGGPFSTPQLKIMQEAITIVVFVVFSLVVLNEKPRWTDLVAFLLIFLGVAVSMLGPSLFAVAK